jgi:uracil-DNA glycosylase
VADFDRGPAAQLAGHFGGVPDPPAKGDFWFDWGPVFYRGRLDGSARVLCVASDPGPTERIAGRTLVGNAGQRVQGLLAKLGLTTSYVCVNAWAYALHPGRASAELKRLGEPVQRQWRNTLYDHVSGPNLQAIIAFGEMAQAAVGQWDSKPKVPVHEVPHPSSRDAKKLLDEWRAAVVALREQVTPDPGGDATGPNYGTSFRESDYAAIPRGDLPFGAPAFLGDDAWVRARPAGGQNSVERSSPDDGHTLIWHAPASGATP